MTTKASSQILPLPYWEADQRLLHAEERKKKNRILLLCKRILSKQSQATRRIPVRLHSECTYNWISLSRSHHHYYFWKEASLRHGESHTRSPLFCYLDSVNKCPSWKKRMGLHAVGYHFPANGTVNKRSDIAEKEKIQDSYSLWSYDEFPRHPGWSRDAANKMHGMDWTAWRKQLTAAVCAIWQPRLFRQI